MASEIIFSGNAGLTNGTHQKSALVRLTEDDLRTILFWLNRAEQTEEPFNHPEDDQLLILTLTNAFNSLIEVKS